MLQRRDSKKKPAQPKENDDHARRRLKVKEGATEEECVAGPVVTWAQAKKSDKVHPLKVKKAMSSVDKSTLKKCFDPIGKPIIRENYVGEFYKKNGLLYWKHQETKAGHQVCRSCDVCQRTVKRDSVKKVPQGSMPLIDTPFKRVAVDIVGPIALPSEAGH